MEQSFRFIAIEELHPVPVCLLLKLEQIPEHFLENIAQNSDVLSKMPLEIKRQAWVLYPKVFREYVEALTKSFVNDFDRLSLYAPLVLDTIEDALAVRNRRKDDKILTELATSIGDSVNLYQYACKTIRSVFIKSKNYACCVMRMELIMILHDLRFSTVIQEN